MREVRWSLLDGACLVVAPLLVACSAAGGGDAGDGGSLADVRDGSLSDTGDARRAVTDAELPFDGIAPVHDGGGAVDAADSPAVDGDTRDAGGGLDGGVRDAGGALDSGRVDTGPGFDSGAVHDAAGAVDSGSRVDAGSDAAGDGSVRAMYGAGSAPVGTPCVGAAVTLDASMTTVAMQSAISHAGAGAYVCFAPGTYRLTDRLLALPGQTFHGSVGSLLKGSVVLTGAAASGGRYVFTGVPLVATGPRVSAEAWCEDTANHPCAYDEDVFLDGQPLARSTTLAGVTAGSYFTDYAVHTVTLATSPAGHTVEIGHVPTAFAIGNPNVTIEGLTLEMFSAGMNNSAIYFNTTATGGTVRNCEVRFTHAVGASSTGGTAFRYNRFHDNGQMGAGAGGTGAVFDHNDFIHNNVFGFYRNDGAEGGLKVDLGTHATVTRNYAADNLSFGIYFDEDADNATIDSNYVEGNWAAGINFVISDVATISNNIVLGNGLGYNTSMRGGGSCTATSINCLNAGIHLVNASHVDVHHNTVSGNANGIALVEFTRAPTGTLVIPLLENNTVHDNVVTLGNHATGVRQFGSPAGYDATMHANVFRNNTYHLASLTGAWFWWNTLETRDQWQAVGQDTTGTFSSP